MSHILLVEDDLPFRRIITLNLAQRGCSVAEADSVESACEMAVAAWEVGMPFDLIILETHLATRCGWDLLRQLRAPEVAGAGMPVPRSIIVSALPVARSRTTEFAPVATLLKPFPISALMRLVERCAEAPDTTPARGA